MRAADFIIEAFDQPYDMSWEKGEAGEDYDALVRLPDGSNLSIMFNEEGPGQYMVEFWRGTEQSVTGEGDAQRIFATVLAAIAKFIQQHQPQSIVFSAHKEDDPEQKSDSRSKLYTRLVQRYAGTMGYNSRSWDTGDSVHYELTRLKPGVAEAFDNPYKGKWKKNEYSNSAQVQTKLSDGTYLQINFSADKTSDGESIVEVEFWRGITQAVTGDGDAQRIFATVLAAIQKYIKKYKPDVLFFSASKQVEPGQNSESRAKLYTRLVQRYAGAWGYQAQVNDVGDVVRYRLTRAQGVAEGSENFNGIDIDMDIEGDEIMVRAMANGRELGHVLFVEDGEYLMPQDLEVDERFQGQGIAATMYDYVKSKGYKIRRSGQQTDAGAGFWDKHKGQGQNVWEQGVAENFADGRVKGKSRPGRVRRAGASCNGSVTDLRQRAKNASGERAKMYHWCANMKSGRSKK